MASVWTRETRSRSCTLSAEACKVFSGEDLCFMFDVPDIRGSLDLILWLFFYFLTMALSQNSPPVASPSGENTIPPTNDLCADSVVVSAPVCMWPRC